MFNSKISLLVFYYPNIAAISELRDNLEKLGCRETEIERVYPLKQQQLIQPQIHGCEGSMVRIRLLNGPVVERLIRNELIVAVRGLQLSFFKENQVSNAEMPVASSIVAFLEQKITAFHISWLTTDGVSVERVTADGGDDRYIFSGPPEKLAIVNDRLRQYLVQAAAPAHSVGSIVPTPPRQTLSQKFTKLQLTTEQKILQSLRESDDKSSSEPRCAGDSGNCQNTEMNNNVTAADSTFRNDVLLQFGTTQATGCVPSLPDRQVLETPAVSHFQHLSGINFYGYRGDGDPPFEFPQLQTFGANPVHAAEVTNGVHQFGPPSLLQPASISNVPHLGTNTGSFYGPMMAQTKRTAQRKAEIVAFEDNANLGQGYTQAVPANPPPVNPFRVGKVESEVSGPAQAVVVSVSQDLCATVRAAKEATSQLDAVLTAAVAGERQTVSVLLPQFHYRKNVNPLDVQLVQHQIAAINNIIGSKAEIQKKSRHEEFLGEILLPALDAHNTADQPQKGIAKEVEEDEDAFGYEPKEAAEDWSQLIGKSFCDVCNCKITVDTDGKAAQAHCKGSRHKMYYHRQHGGQD